jgi:hypothetical protein
MKLKELLVSEETCFSDLTESELAILNEDLSLLEGMSKLSMIRKQLKLVFGIPDPEKYVFNVASGDDTYNISLDKLNFAKAKEDAPILKKYPELKTACATTKDKCFKLIKSFLLKVRAFNTFDFGLDDDILVIKPVR